ncbi:armadillo-type protein [Schizophyllum commune]
MDSSDGVLSSPATLSQTPARARQQSALNSSIWAPQPQIIDTTWPRTIDSYAQTASALVDGDFAVGQGRDYAVGQGRDFAVDQSRLKQGLTAATNLTPITREDVFGPVGGAGGGGGGPRNSVGAIGDGRQKASPRFEDIHVEQLLRTLNLNSPEPYVPKPPLSLSFDASPTSPEFSPASASSVLLTPTDLSPARSNFDLKLQAPYELSALSSSQLSQNSLLIDPASPTRNLTLDHHFSPSQAQAALYRHQQQQQSQYAISANSTYPYFFEPLSEQSSPVTPQHAPMFHSSPATPVTPHALYNSPPIRRVDTSRISVADWNVPLQLQPLLLQQQQQAGTAADWLRRDAKSVHDYGSSLLPAADDGMLRQSFSYHQSPQQLQSPSQSTTQQNQSSHVSSSPHEPINFLSLLHPSSSPPYHVFVSRIIKSSDQQASIFLQQKLKVADATERGKIVDAICARGFEMMAHRQVFGNWAVQRCLEAAATAEERRKIVTCMRGRIVELATNCYGCHVLQKALDCEEDIRLLIVSELLHGDPAQTLVNKHASHVWSKIMELSWTPPAPPIFAYVNKSLKGKWAALACHETGSLVVQHAFENLEDSAKDGIVDEILHQGSTIFSEVCKNQWGSYCVQHILEHGSDKHRQMTLDHLTTGLLEYATNEQGSKSVTKALKEGGKDTLDRIIKRMCEPAKGARRAMIVDLALSVTGSQLIASILPTADKDQRAMLYDCIRGHIVTLRGCKTGSKVIWLFDRMRAYYGY